MSIYREVIAIIDANHLTIKKNKVYDSQSGWHGIEYNVYDGDTFIVDLAANGFALSESSLRQALVKIRTYLALKYMETMDDFVVWLDEVSE